MGAAAPHTARPPPAPARPPAPSPLPHPYPYNQNVSNFLWAFAKLEVGNHELFAAAGRHAARIMHTFQPQSIANMIWAYATAGEMPDPSFLQASAPQSGRLFLAVVM